MVRNPLILRDADWMLQAARPGRPHVPPVAVPGACVATPPAAQADDGEALRRQAAYGQGFQAGRQAMEAELAQRAQALSSEQARLRDAMARLQQVQQAQRQQQAAAERQTEVQRAALQRLLQQLPQAWERCLQDAEEDMLALVFETLCRIMGEQAVDSEGVRAMLQRTVQAWHGRRPLSVHVHPDDLAMLQADAALGQMLSASGFSCERQTLRWVADPAVQLGGCLLRSEEGALDARLEVQLQAVRATLAQVRQMRRLARQDPAAAAPAGEAPA